MTSRKDGGHSATRVRMAAMLGGDGTTAAVDGGGQTPPAEPLRGPDRAVEGRVRPMRLSVDLAPVSYQRLGQWVLDTGAVLGQKVTHVAVFRALLDELLNDEALQDRVRRRLNQR